MADTPILDTTKLDANASAAEMSGASTTSQQTCPLNVNKIQLLPLRYALVENMQPEANILNKAKTVSEQSPMFEKITSHPIGIRFMRNGWLYVYKYNTEGPHILGFRIIDGKIITGTKIDQAGNKTAEKPALFIDKTQDIQIRVCFAEIEWTTNKAKQVIENEAQRQLLMYPIVVGNLSCEFQSANIITKEQAPKNIADATEKHIPQTNYYRVEEDTPYIWQYKLNKITPKQQIGKLTEQLIEDGAQGHYAYIIVADPIGMMRDLEQEQQKLTQWRQEWGEETTDQNTNDFLYTMAHYINGLRNVSDTSAPKYDDSTDNWLEKLTPQQRQSIYDYINISNKNQRTDRDRKGNEGYSYTLGYILNVDRATNEEIFADEVQYRLEREKQNQQIEQTMMEQLGGVDTYYKQYKTKVENLKKQHYNDVYGSYVLGNQGIYDVIDNTKLDSFLSKHNAYLKRWSTQIDKVTDDRVFLFTEYFHRATWYFDLDNKDQLLDLQAVEASCVVGMVRTLKAVESLKAFFNEYPYYLLPGYHISSYTHDVFKMGATFKGLLNDTASFIKTLKTMTIEEDVDLAQAFPKDYWRKIVDFSAGPMQHEELKAFRQAIEDTYGTAALSSLNEVIDENMQRIPEKMQQRIKSTSGNIADTFDSIKKVDIGARATMFYAIKQQGLLFTENNLAKQLTLQLHFERIYNQLEILKTLNSHIDELQSKLGERITKPDGSTVYKYEGVERDKINTEIAIQEKKLTAGSIKVNMDCNDLLGKISPVDNDQMPFTLKSTDNSRRINYSEINNIEKDFMGLKGFGNSIKLAPIQQPWSLFKSVWLPATMTYFQGEGLVEAWTSFLKNGKLSDIPVILGVLAGTYASAQSTLQAGYTLLVQNAIAQITAQAEAATGAKVGGTRLATRLGKFSLITGSLAQYAGFYSSVMNIYQNNGEWFDAMGKGDSRLSAAAATLIVTNYSNATIGVVASVDTTIAIAKMRNRLTLLRGLYDTGKIANLTNATSRAWAVRGMAFNSRMALLAKPAVLLTLAQFGAEYLYNRYNLTDTQSWAKNSVWGIENKAWTEKEHYRQMAKTISEPSLIYLGEKGEVLYNPPNSQYQAYRYLHLVLKGQSYAMLDKHNVQWEAGWSNDPQQTNRYANGGILHTYPDQQLTELLKKNATVVSTDPLIIQFKIPFNCTQGYKTLGSEPAKTLALRVWYTPDLEDEPLGVKEKYTFSVDFPLNETSVAPRIATLNKGNNYYPYFKGKYKTEFTLADAHKNII